MPKTKLMVTGRETTEEDRAPLHINNIVIESVTEFLYLESIVAVSGRVDTEVDKRIAEASKAFGALHKAVFQMALCMWRPKEGCTRHVCCLYYCIFDIRTSLRTPAHAVLRVLGP